MAQNSIYSLIEKAKQQQSILSPNLNTAKAKLDLSEKSKFSFASNLNNLNRKITAQQFSHSKKVQLLQVSKPSVEIRQEDPISPELPELFTPQPILKAQHLDDPVEKPKLRSGTEYASSTLSNRSQLMIEFLKQKIGETRYNTVIDIINSEIGRAHV